MRNTFVLASIALLVPLIMPTSVAVPTIPPLCGSGGGSPPGCLTNEVITQVHQAINTVQTTVTNSVTKCQPVDEPFTCATAVATATATCGHPYYGTYQCSAVSTATWGGHTVTPLTGHVDGVATSAIYLRSIQTVPYMDYLSGSCDWGLQGYACAASAGTDTYTDVCTGTCPAAFAYDSVSVSTRATSFMIVATAAAESVASRSCPGEC